MHDKFLMNDKVLIHQSVTKQFRRFIGEQHFLCNISLHIELFFFHWSVSESFERRKTGRMQVLGNGKNKAFGGLRVKYIIGLEHFQIKAISYWSMCACEMTRLRLIYRPIIGHSKMTSQFFLTPWLVTLFFILLALSK